MVMDLVVPFYNPRQGWETKFVANINTLIDEHFGGDRNALQITIVNDGSTALFTDTETAFVRTHIPGIEIVSYAENKGKGYALREGVAKTRTKYCVYSDNDFPFGLGAVREMYDTLLNGADIVAACRTSGNYFRHLPFKRRVASKGLAFVNKHVFGLRVADTQAGMKAFNTKGRELFLTTTTDRFLFDMEFILLAGKTKGIDIREVNVNIASGIKMTDFSRKTMRQEINNLVRIILKRRNGK